MNNWLFVFLIFLFACNTGQSKKDFRNDCRNELSSAKHFFINPLVSSYVINVINPWQSSKNIEYSYTFVKGKTETKGEIQIPVKRVICFSTSHIGFISLLKEQSSIIGFSGLKFISDSVTRELISSKKIVDVGYEESLNYELIISLKPDAILVYGVETEKVGYLTKLQELGLPVIYVAEYLEDTPLAKAEWIKFFGVLYDKVNLSDSIFSKTEKEYTEIKNIASHFVEKPTVFSGLPWKDSWFISGGRSYVAQFIKDAGANYIWSDDSSHESFPLNLERVYEKAANADYWINSGVANSLKDIKLQDERLTLFKAYSLKKVYNNNLRSKFSEGNDYWESGVVQPQKVLKDMVEIFHPGTFKNYNLYYYRHLE